VDDPRNPSQDEREFWDRQFGDDTPPPRRTQPSVAPRPRPRLAPPRPGASDVHGDRLVDRLLDRVQERRSDARFGIVVLVVVALVAGVVWYRIGVGGASAGEAPAARPSRTSATTAAGDRPAGTSTTVPSSSARLVVHVAGAVAHPGVVELAPGSRVIDAVEAVGGAVAEGDLDRLNLAAKVVDGQRVYVARAGEADPGVAAEGDPGGGTGGDSSGAAGGKVNLNTATQAQLEELPGIGPTYAQSIIAERQRRGGFKSVNELRSVRGIGDKRFAELAPLVTV
jgi:competence protein ComEA